MKDKITIIGIIGLVAMIWFMAHDTQAGELEITQQLYDQALTEIENGDRDQGCRILHQAFAHSSFINDNWKAYNQIWKIGTRACNWTIRPDTIETSSQKQ